MSLEAKVASLEAKLAAAEKAKALAVARATAAEARATAAETCVIKAEAKAEVEGAHTKELMKTKLQASYFSCSSQLRGAAWGPRLAAAAQPQRPRRVRVPRPSLRCRGPQHLSSSSACKPELSQKHGRMSLAHEPLYGKYLAAALQQSAFVSVLRRCSMHARRARLCRV